MSGLTATLGSGRTAGLPFSRRGFIVTLDALLAVMLAGLIASSALALINDAQKLDWKEVYLQRVLDDAVAVVDEAGFVTTRVRTTAVEQTLDLLPDGVCVQLSFTNKGAASPHTTILRNGCGSPADSVSVARRQSFYFANGALNTWTIILAKGWYE